MRDGMHGSTQLTDPGRPARLAALVAALATVVVLIAAPTAQAGSRPPDGFPAAGELLVNTVSVRARPDPGSRVVRRLTRLRPTFQVQVILALRQRLGSDGFVWYQLSLPGRPNGQRGWVRAAQVDVRPVANRIVVSIRRRVLEVRRVTNGRVLLRTVVAVGLAGGSDPARPELLRPVRVRAPGTVLRLLCPRDECIREPVRLAGRRHRRHPRDEPAPAPRPGCLAWLRASRKFRGVAASKARPAGHADRHHSLVRAP